MNLDGTYVGSFKVNERRNKRMKDNKTFMQPFQITITEKNYPILVEPPTFQPTEEGYEVPIPQLIEEMKITDPPLALKWRLQIKRIMQILFNEDYSIIAVRKTDEPVNYYQFIKKEKISS